MTTARSAEDFAAVVLSGGAGSRLGGADKASLRYGGRTLLECALAAVAGAREVVVVGPPAATSVPATFVLEEPPGGGPAAGLLAGLDAVAAGTGLVVVLAVDMPRVTGDTVRRLRRACTDGYDGAFLVDAEGRRQLAGVLRGGRVRPPAQRDGLALHRLLGGLVLRSVPALGEEAADVDTWADLRDLQGPGSA